MSFTFVVAYCLNNLLTLKYTVTLIPTLIKIGCTLKSFEIYIFLIWLSNSKNVHYFTDYSCNQVTAESGLLSSYASTDMISSLNVKHGTSVTLGKKSMALITVQLNQTIWLAFNKFNVEENHILKVKIELSMFFSKFLHAI